MNTTMPAEPNAQAPRAIQPNKSEQPCGPRKLRYSPCELRLLGFLPEGGERITSTALVAKLYPHGGEPFYARSNVLTTMRMLMRKIAFNEEPFTVVQSAQAGPVPLQYWIEGRSQGVVAACEINRLVTRGYLEATGEGTYRATVAA
jgi:hypothetical protein